MDLKSLLCNSVVTVTGLSLGCAALLAVVLLAGANGGVLRPSLAAGSLVVAFGLIALGGVAYLIPGDRWRSRHTRDGAGPERDEELLRASEARFRAAIAAVSDIVWTNDPQGKMQGEQPGWGAFTGQDRATYQGYGWSQAVHPDDAGPTVAAWEDAVAAKRVFTFEHRVRRHDGEWRTCSIRAVPVLDPRGEIAEWVGVHTDVTERRRAEESLRESEDRFRTMADSIPQLAWVADAGTEGQVHWFNRNWYDYTGTTLEQMAGSGWQSVHHPDHAERVVMKFRHHVRAGLDWEDTFPLRGKDGQYRWFLSRMRVLRDGTGAVTRIFGTNTDVTEQRDAEDALRKLACELAEADRRKDEFLATLAHELRNSLSPIRNGLHILRESEEAGKAGRTLAMMDRQLTHMVRLVDDLFDLSRISRGKIDFSPGRLELRTLVEAVAEDARPIVEKAGHELAVALPDAPIYVEGDATRLSQVVANLLEFRRNSLGR